MIVLPFPPSVNQMFGQHGGRKRFKSAKYKQWLNEAWLVPLNERFVTVYAEYTYFWPDKRVRDLENYTKAVSDFLVSRKVIPDDSWHHIQSLTLRSGGIDRDNPRVEIILKNSVDLSG